MVVEILEIRPSNRDNKRLKVVMLVDDKKKTIHFGAKERETYIDHGDKLRRKNYRARAESFGIENITKPNTWSYWLLWGRYTDIRRNYKAMRRMFKFIDFNAKIDFGLS